MRDGIPTMPSFSGVLPRGSTKAEGFHFSRAPETAVSIEGDTDEDTAF
jgi:hypothetical protein